MSDFMNVNSQQPQFGAGAAQSAPTDDGMTWWFRWLIKIAAVVFGIIGFILGCLTAISVSLSCIIAGVILLLSSFLVLAFEVPICCSFIQFIEPLTKFSEARPHWQKVLIYMIPPVIVIIMCPSVTPILGSLCLVAVAALYFMLAIGKKAPLNQMMTRASESKTTLPTTTY